VEKFRNILKFIRISAIAMLVILIFMEFNTNLNDFTITYNIYFIIIALTLVLTILPERIIKLNKLKNKVDYNEFNLIYQDLLLNHKQELDRYRKQIIIKRIVQFILLTTFILMFLGAQLGWNLYLYGEFAKYTPYIAIGVMIIFFITFFVNTKAEMMYRKTYKNKVIGELITSFGKDLSYSDNLENKSAILNTYIKAGFDMMKYNSSDVDDYITGYLEDGLLVSMADLNLTYVTRSRKSTREENIFTGMFVDVTCNKNVNSTIKILTNGNQRHSKLDLFNKECEKLEMDSQNFEKYFNVYTNSKVAAMQMLTSEIMEILTEFRNAFGVELEIVIKDNHIYIRFHTGHMFEAKLLRGSINKNDILRYYGVLKMITTVTKKMNEIIVNSDI